MIHRLDRCDCHADAGLRRPAVHDAATAQPADEARPGSRTRDLVGAPSLMIRATVDDRGERPLAAPFWESPDIFVAPYVAPRNAPSVPPTFGGLATAGVENTVWARVWNTGAVPVSAARVEFYWSDPALTVSSDSCHLIGSTWVDLGSRASGRGSAIVKCPTPWYPKAENGGHECLVVRVFDPVYDAIGPQPWNPYGNRHVGQRNVAVVEARSPAALSLDLRLRCGSRAATATLTAEPVDATTVHWVRLLSATRGPLRAPRTIAEAYGSIGFRPATAAWTAASGDGFVRTLRVEPDDGDRFVSTNVRVENLVAGEFRTFRVIQHVDGEIAGGYTVIARRRL